MAVNGSVTVLLKKSVWRKDNAGRAVCNRKIDRGGIGNPNALYRAFGRSAGLLKRAREFPDAHIYSLLIFLEASL
jgi:hypothetical protein